MDGEVAQAAGILKEGAHACAGNEGGEDKGHNKTVTRGMRFLGGELGETDRIWD